jgi:hypothetical protein
LFPEWCLLAIIPGMLAGVVSCTENSGEKLTVQMTYNKLFFNADMSNSIIRVKINEEQLFVERRIFYTRGLPNTLAKRL